MKMYSTRLASLILIALLLSCGSADAKRQSAQREPGPTPSERPAPMLERINAETQALYEHVRPGLVRVQLPLPKWMEQLGQQDNPINRWPLDPQVREMLESQQGKLATGQMQAIIPPTTQPQTEGTTQPSDADQQRWQR